MGKLDNSIWSGSMMSQYRAQQNSSLNEMLSDLDGPKISDSIMLYPSLEFCCHFQQSNISSQAKIFFHMSPITSTVEVGSFSWFPTYEYSSCKLLCTQYIQICIFSSFIWFQLKITEKRYLYHQILKHLEQIIIFMYQYSTNVGFMNKMDLGITSLNGTCLLEGGLV